MCLLNPDVGPEMCLGPQAEVARCIKESDVWSRLVGDFHFETKDRMFSTQVFYILGLRIELKHKKRSTK